MGLALCSSSGPPVCIWHLLQCKYACDSPSVHESSIHGPTPLWRELIWTWYRSHTQRTRALWLRPRWFVSVVSKATQGKVIVLLLLKIFFMPELEIDIWYMFLFDNSWCEYYTVDMGQLYSFASNYTFIVLWFCITSVLYRYKVIWKTRERESVYWYCM